jgi:MOSC domain-containing protein YiiM
LGKIVAVCVSRAKGTTKKNVGRGSFRVGVGLEGDAHSGDWHRQVSLLAVEWIREAAEKGFKVEPGSFAENLTTEGFDLLSVRVGDRLSVGSNVALEVTQIGKECHTRCAIFHKVGDCIMPDKGVFAIVVSGGEVVVGDPIAKSEAIAPK